MGDDRYKVRSSSGHGFYEVHKTPDARWLCECDDYTERDNPNDPGKIAPCKHIAAVRHYLQGGQSTLLASSSEGRPSYGQNWSAYDKAQQAEGRLLPILLRGLLDEIPEPEYKTGRPPIPLRDQAYASVIKVFGKASSRRARSHLERGHEWGHLKKVPNYSTMSRFLTKPEHTTILYGLVHRSAQVVAGVETTWAVDSTGFRTTSFGAYHGEKHSHLRGNTWLKAHLLVGVGTHIIGAVLVTDAYGRETGDAANLIPLVTKAHENGLRVERILGDKAYATRENYAHAEKVGAEAYLDFRQGHYPRKLFEPTAWKKAYAMYTGNHEEFMQRYHARSNVEAAISAIKRKHGETLFSKKRVAQENELLCKVLAYNLSVIVHEMHVHGLEPEWRVAERPDGAATA